MENKSKQTIYLELSKAIGNLQIELSKNKEKDLIIGATSTIDTLLADIKNKENEIATTENQLTSMEANYNKLKNYSNQIDIDSLEHNQLPIDVEYKETEMLLEDVISKNAKEQGELQLINNSVTVYYERKSMENEDLCSKLEELSQKVIQTDLSLKYINQRYESYTAYSLYYETLKEQNVKLDRMITATKEYIKSMGEDSSHEKAVVQFNETLTELKELIDLSSECTKAAKISIKEQTNA